MRATATIGAVAVAVVLAAACTASESSAPTTTAGEKPAPTTEPPATTTPPTTTAATTTTTTEPPGVTHPRRVSSEASGDVDRMPLTGRVLRDQARAPQRPALVVKIDNNALARPQSGLNGADVVFEEIVEYGTRFAAVYHSSAANPVGPIRSGRTQDIDMLGTLNRPLFAWSGGNSGVMQAIGTSPLVSLVHGSAGGYWRSGGRSAPHNLYNSTDDLWAQAPGNWEQPSPLFRYVHPGTQFRGTPSAGVDLRMDSDRVGWRWDRPERTYKRWTNGAPHGLANGPVTTDNVVVLDVQYRPSWADARSPEGQTVGSGEAWVFSNGQLVHGRWSRSGRHAPYLLTTGKGPNERPILLSPGRTFVELANVSADGRPSPIT